MVLFVLSNRLNKAPNKAETIARKIKDIIISTNKAYPNRDLARECTKLNLTDFWHLMKFDSTHIGLPLRQFLNSRLVMLGYGKLSLLSSQNLKKSLRSTPAKSNNKY